ncbi:Sterile alpha motif domain-containing protein 9-like [Triplophysa tibetana]|uniref:Sterile alpha motif domain-containing protein 9-like n=1 Tax=Triplophysa tibetana TaxID=1572043 RepID=A0A5A9PMD6_9TELE|nr:Sterile alpha motif domain-containing protein 9-like [Triplophysa tibetana]
MAKSSMSSEDASQTQHAECSPNNALADKSTKLKKIENWTKEDVRHWLMDVIKVPQQYADILYKEDVYGAALILFDKKDFLDAGLKHGPAVQILKNMSQYKASSDVLKNSAIPAVEIPTDGSNDLEITPKLSIPEIQDNISSVQQLSKPTDTASLGETTTDRRPTNGSNGPKINPELSIQENKDGITSVLQWSLPTDDTPKFIVDDGKFLHDTPRFQEEKDKNESGVRCTQSTKLPLPHSTNQENSLNSLKGALIRLCTPRPFDESCPTFVYTQNEILPPETGPSNLIDPVHEYKLMANTENASEEDALRKFTDEVFRFAAGSLNTRTNGTIHFGVGDEPLYTHGQIVGISVTSLNKYIDAFYKRLKVHFTNRVMREIVMRCIRPPKFFQVKCPDNLDVDKWVIEVDVVPMYDLTKEKLFYTTTDKKRRKTKCFFVRDGARTTNYNPDKGPRKEMHTEKHLENYVKSWASSRKLAEERYSNVHKHGLWGMNLEGIQSPSLAQVTYQDPPPLPCMVPP